MKTNTVDYIPLQSDSTRTRRATRAFWRTRAPYLSARAIELKPFYRRGPRETRRSGHLKVSARVVAASPAHPPRAPRRRVVASSSSRRASSPARRFRRRAVFRVSAPRIGGRARGRVRDASRRLASRRLASRDARRTARRSATAANVVARVSAAVPRGAARRGFFASIDPALRPSAIHPHTGPHTTASAW